MKILRFDTYETIADDAVLMADSVRRPDHRPLFRPEEPDAEMRISLRVAMRVDRLGKSIAERFADRYYGAAGIVAVISGRYFTPYSDDAVIEGRWMPLDDPALEQPLSFCGQPLGRSLDIDRAHARHLLATASATATFKTGDVIILPGDIIVADPAQVSEIELLAGDTQLIQFAIK